MTITTTELAQGKRLLRDLLPWARAEVRKAEDQAVLDSPLAHATAQYVTEDNFYALVVHPAPAGGWHADLLLREVPPGFSNCIGTPVGEPCRTRQEAEEKAKWVLCSALSIAAKQRPGDGKAVFWLYDTALKIPPEVYRIALGEFPGGAGGPDGGYPSKEHAIERIEDKLEELFPGGFDYEKLTASDRDTQANLMAVLMIATLSGVFVYPPRLDRSPSHNEAPAATKH